MFSLHYKIDDVVNIEGKDYQINGAFDSILKLIDVLRDKRLPKPNKLNICLKVLFGKDTDIIKYPLETQLDIFNSVFNEYVQPKEKPKQYDLQGNEMPVFEEDTKQSYSLKHDAEYIYSSFMQAYRIDLIEEQGKLHWFKFKALLNGLPEDTKFSQVVSIRTWKKPSTNSKNSEETQMKKLQEIYALPEEESEGE